MKLAAALCLFASSLTASLSASAAGTHACGALDSISALIGNTKSVDDVKLAYVSTEEPAAAPDHLLVFVYDKEMGVTCTAISRDDQGSGFGYVNMTTLKSVSYDSKLGRLFEITVTEPNYDGDTGKAVKVRFRTNSITGTVSLEK